MNHLELETLLNTKLSSGAIKDYCPNGLQIEGKTEITKIVTGVTASQALIEKAIEREADAIPVSYTHLTLPTNREV